MSTQSEAGRSWSSRPSSSDRASELDPGSRSPSAGPREGKNMTTIISMSSSPAEDLVDERQTDDLLQIWTRTTPHSSEAEIDPEKTKQYGSSRALTDLPPRGSFASDLQNPPKSNIIPMQIEQRTRGSIKDSSPHEPTSRSINQPSALTKHISLPTTAPNLLQQTPLATTNNATNRAAQLRVPTAEDIFPNIYMMEETRAFYKDRLPPFAFTNKIYKAGFHFHPGGPEEPGGLGYRHTKLDIKNLQFLFGGLVTSPVEKLYWTPWNEGFNAWVVNLGSLCIFVVFKGNVFRPWMGPDKQFDEMTIGRGFRDKENSTLYGRKSRRETYSTTKFGGATSIHVQSDLHGSTPALNASAKRRRTLGEDDTEDEDEDEDDDGVFSPDRPRRTKRAPVPAYRNGGSVISFSAPRRKGGRHRLTSIKRRGKPAPRTFNKVVNTPASRASAHTANASVIPSRAQAPAIKDLTAGLSNQKLSKTRLHISLSTNNYGSVPVYLKSCPTMDSFFDTCFDAWDLHGRATQIGAITATLSWLPKSDQTMVVMRKIPDSYQYLLDAIDKAPCWEGDDDATCDVRVKVIMEAGTGAAKY